MKRLFSNHPPIFSLIFFSAMAEVLMGCAYFPIVLLQASNHPLCEVLRLLFVFLHILISAIVLTASLCHFSRHTLRGSLLALAFFLLSLILKNLIGGAFSYTMVSGYNPGDAFLLSLLDTLLNTLLAEGLFLAAVYFFAWLFFLYARPAPPPATSPFGFSENPLTRAALFICACLTLRSLISLMIFFVSFGREVYWLFRTSEILSLLSEFFVIIAAGFCILPAVWQLCLKHSEEPEK